MSPPLPSKPPTLIVGTMNFGGRTPEAEAIRIVHCALDRGLRHFDTANTYQNGVSEQILGKALQSQRTEARVATKVGLNRVAGRPEGLAPQRVNAAILESLQRLQRDYVDLYYLHAPDASVPFQDTVLALQPLLASGQIRSWGVSNHAAWQILEIQYFCDSQGIPKPAVSQVLYNLLIRQLDIEYWDFTRAHPIATSVYNPLAGGLLARETSPGAPVPAQSRFHRNPLYQRRYWTPTMHAQALRYRTLAQEFGMSLLTLAYAWLASTPGVDSILLGPGTVAQLDEAINACATPLPPELRSRVEALHVDFLGTDTRYAR